MKITKEHYAYIKRAIECALVDKPLDALEARYRLEGLSPLRYRFDCLYAARLSTWLCDNVYAYADDTHIDTALRAVMREMGLLWAAQR